MAFKVWNDGVYGRTTHIEIDGEDVTGKFHQLVITAGIDGMVDVALGMPVAEQNLPGRPARLAFPVAGQRELLVKHGWTPPADDNSVVESLSKPLPVMSQEEQDAEWLGMSYEQRLAEALMLISIVEASPDGEPVPVDDRLEGGLMVNQCDEKKRARAARMVASRDREVEARLKARGKEATE